MSFNEQQPPPPPSHLFGAWSDFRQNLPGFPFNHDDDHEFLCQYGDHPDILAHKRARQSENYLPNFPPPAGRGGTGHIFYKTRLCVKLSDGNCPNGDSCNFAHGVHDLRQPPSNWQELVGGGGGKELGTGRSDEEHRKNHIIRVCKRYSNGEECPYGEKCVFLHQRPTPAPSFLEFETAGGRESVAITIGVSSNQSRTGGYKSETNNNNNKPHLWKSRNHFDHVQTGGSHASRSRNEADTTVKSRVIQSKPFVAAASPFGDPVAVAGHPSIKTREKDDNISRWKLNKKINHIYADWLDDLSPLRNVVSEPET